MALVWDMESARPMASGEAPPPEIRARASSSYTRGTITRRLQAIRGETSDEAQREREFLRDLLAREFPEE